MRILITGAAGLYGYNLVKDLQEQKFVEKIYALDNFSRKYIQKDPLIEFRKNPKII